MFESRVARAWRGVAAAGIATFTAAVSHSVADGAPASFIGIVLALLLAVPLCIALAGRRLSWTRLAIAVTVSQFALHGLLLLGVAGATGPRAMPAGHVHTADLVMTVTPVASLPHVGHSDSGMWLAHAFAAFLTVLAIGRGERVLRALVDLFGWRLVSRVLTWRSRAAVRPFAPSIDVRPLTAATLLWSVMRRRGPPLAA